MYLKMFTFPYTLVEKLVETLPMGVKDTERDTKLQKKDIEKENIHRK